jgi:hypothetical protein
LPSQNITCRSNIKNLPTYPAPTQQIFFTPPPLDLIAASREVPLVLCFPLPEAASSNASCNFKACKTGLNVKLPSGVVGAVEMSSRVSSDESMLEEGMERFLYIFGTQILSRKRVGRSEILRPFFSSEHQQEYQEADLKTETSAAR